jgi:hypothetical protein
MNTDTLQKKDLKTPMETRALYLDLMKKCIVGTIYEDYEVSIVPMRHGLRKIVGLALDGLGMQLVKRVSNSERLEGRVWPVTAHTMIGTKRLENVQQCVEDVIKNNVPGDLIETGVWRGGTCIFMRAILKAYDVHDRTVWVADSFQGIPKPTYEIDRKDPSGNPYKELAIPQEEVQANFAAYGLLDDQVKFLKGWFKDTLPTAPIGKLAVARLDGDLYESTTDSLVNLYPKLSVGGYLIVDDYGAIPACKQAVQDYRKQHGVRELIVDIDGFGAYWRKERYQ